jgi:ABC-type transporter Mla subunit MlaD
MDEHLLLVIMAVFVGVATVAMVIQACMLFGIYKASRAMQQNTERLTPKVEALIESSRHAIDDSRTQIIGVTTRANDILDSARKQMARVDELLSDAASRTRRQMDHAELVLDDAMDRAEKTIATVHGGVMKPIREINAVAAGLRAALHFLMRGGRPSPDQVTVDEEMFI